MKQLGSRLRFRLKIRLRFRLKMRLRRVFSCLATYPYLVVPGRSTPLSVIPFELCPAVCFQSNCPMAAMANPILNPWATAKESLPARALVARTAMLSVSHEVSVKMFGVAAS